LACLLLWRDQARDHREVRKSSATSELPPGAVTPEDLSSWDLEFMCLVERIGPLFGRPEPREHAENYLRGLLSPLERKNGWTIAELSGQHEPKATQRFLNLTDWDADKLRDVNLAYARENFADPRGTLIADPTGFAKKGRMSAGVQRQYSGTLGKIDNCQIGTFLAYADSAGNRVLVDRELYVPRESWFGDPGRCRKAGIPEDVTFATRPQQVRAMVERVVAAGLPFAWFTADEEFGQNPGLREFLEDSEIAYVMAIPKNTAVTLPDGKEKAIAEIPPGLRENDWQRRACGIGAKGFRVYDWALITTPAPGFQYMIRRSVDDGELAYYICFNPRREPFGELVRVAGSRWPVEECFEAAKNEAGLDHYQVRLYRAWYRHVTLDLWTTFGGRHRSNPGTG
jgi:SRSO17 transposase